jgi:hypothetical protein
LAAAAAIAAVAGAAGWLALRAPEKPSVAHGGSTKPASNNVTPDSKAGAGVAPVAAPTATRERGPEVDQPTAPRVDHRVRHGAPRPRRATENPKAAEAPTTSRPDPQEITTDFLPVMYGGNLAPIESGHVVRVELPRSALVSVGLPMNAERADERVVADVLVGQDGLARAIRFVH